MRWLLSLLALPIVAAVPIVSSIVVDDVGHSSVRVTWNSDVTPDNQRIVYGPTAGYGSTLTSYQPVAVATGQQMTLTGLTPGTTYHFSPESHNADGWSVAVDQTVVLDALPAIHPAPPIAPATFTSAYPDTIGYTVVTTTSDCSDLQSLLNTANSNKTASGTVVKIPVSNTCALVIRTLVDPDAKSILAASVNTGTNTITSTAHGYSNGQRVRVSGADPAIGGVISSGLKEGIDYCISGATANTFVLKDWPACSSTISLVSQGSATWYVMAYPPPSSFWVVLRSAAADAALPPDGVRLTTAWQASLAPLKVPTVGLGILKVGFYLGPFAHHWYLGPGIEFTTPSSAQSGTVDPILWQAFIETRPSNDRITIARNYIHGLGYPERMARMFYFLEGSNIALKDNYTDKTDFWHTWRTGLLATADSSTVIRVSAGTYHLGSATCVIGSSFTATISAGSTGNAYISMPTSCAPSVIVPADATVVCSGCTKTVGTNWSLNGDGRQANGIIAAVAISGATWGAITSYDDSNNPVSADGTEGSQCLITRFGPGPMEVSNNYFANCPGITHNFDNTGFDNPLPSDVVIKRNYFYLDPSRRIGSATSDGLAYPHRNPFEIKAGQRFLITGNICDNAYAYITAGAFCFEIVGNSVDAPIPSANRTDDIDLVSNIARHSAGGFGLNGGTPSSYAVPHVGRRWRLHNNLAFDIDAWTYVSTNYRAYGIGQAIQTGHGGEDFVFSHNTLYSIGGALPVCVYGLSKPREGQRITDNICYSHDDGNKLLSVFEGQTGTTPDCWLLTGKAWMDCALTPSYTFSGNVILGGYSNSQTMTGSLDPATLNTSATYSTFGSSLIRLESTVAGRLAAMKFSGTPSNSSSTSYRLRYDSPYISGAGLSSDGLGAGADIDAVDDATGMISNMRALSITASAASINFHAPDGSTACKVGYGTSADPTAWTATAANTDATKERTIALSGLAGTTAYNWQVWCSGTAPSTTNQFTTR